MTLKKKENIKRYQRRHKFIFDLFVCANDLINEILLPIEYVKPASLKFLFLSQGYGCGDVGSYLMRKVFLSLKVFVVFFGGKQKRKFPTSMIRFTMWTNSLISILLSLRESHFCVHKFTIIYPKVTHISELLMIHSVTRSRFDYRLKNA